MPYKAASPGPNGHVSIERKIISMRYFLQVQDKYRYVEQRRTTLLKHCAEGVEHDFWRFTT